MGEKREVREKRLDRRSDGPAVGARQIGVQQRTTGARKLPFLRAEVELSRMRSWQRPFFLGRSLCGEQAFPQGLLVFSRPPEAACPFFAIFPPLLTFRGEALRWHLRCVLSPEGFPCTSTRPSRCSLGAVWTIAPPWPPSVTSSTPSPIRPCWRVCGRPVATAV